VTPELRAMIERRSREAREKKLKEKAYAICKLLGAKFGTHMVMDPTDLMMEPLQLRDSRMRLPLIPGELQCAIAERSSLAGGNNAASGCVVRVRCRTCGTEVGATKKFLHFSGTPPRVSASPLAAPQEAMCPNCGVRVNVRSRKVTILAFSRRRPFSLTLRNTIGWQVHCSHG